MKQRVRGSKDAVIDNAEDKVKIHKVLLGVDPSLRGTGYGVIRLGKETSKTPAYGTIKCPTKWSRSECLAAITLTLREVIRDCPQKGKAIHCWIWECAEDCRCKDGSKNAQA